ncbi:MAG: tetratricopeptide repeat protein [Phycisphaeraceae bacterium]
MQTHVEQADAAVLRELLEVDRRLDLGLRDPLLQALTDHGADVDSETLTRLALDPQNPQATAEAIAEVLEQPSHRDDPSWWARYARALDAADDPKALDAWREAVSLGGDTPRLLRAALDSPSVLQEPDFYRELVSRLRSSTADDAVGWKIAEARYLLTHEPGGDAARRAEGLLREVIELSPRRGEALVLLAEAHQQLGEREREIAMLERAWQTRGEANVDLGLRIVDLYFAAGEPQRADAALDRLAAADDLSTADARRIAGKLLESSRIRDAVGLLEDRTQGDTQASRELVPMLADLYLALGRRAQAVQRFSDILPDADAGTLGAAVSFFARLGETQRARELLERLAKIDPSNAVKHRVEFASRWGNDGELVEVLDEALERDPGAAWIHLAMIQHRWEHNDMEGAASAIQRARGELPEHEAFAALEQALPLVRSVSDHAGLRILFRGMLDSADDADACLDAMRVLAAVERGEAAEESAAAELVSLAEASRAEPVVAAAAGLLIDIGRLRAAADLATSHMSDEPSPRLAEIAARAWVALDKPASAMPAAFAWHRRDPNNPRAAAMIVRASAMMGKPQDRLVTRLSATLESLAAQPEPSLADLREISLALLAAGRGDPVRDTLTPLLDDAGAWRRLWLGLAIESIDSSNSRADAMAWIGPLLDHAELADPDETTAISDGLRRIAERLEDEDFAQTRLELLDNALDASPTHLGLLQHRAITLEQSGEIDQAVEAYERVLERDPDNVIALNNLALLLSELGRDLERARSLIDRAIAQRPKLAALHDTRGEVLSAMDRSGEATAAYQTAISLQPEVMKWRVHLARHLASTENWQHTRRVLDEIGTMAGLRADAVSGELRDEYLAIREAARAAPAAE